MSDHQTPAAWLRAHGLGEADLARFGAFSEAGRIIFPLRSFGGQWCGDLVRVFGAQERYRKPRGVRLSLLLYGLDQTYRAALQAGSLVLVEGPADVLALVRAGVPYVTAVLGSQLSQVQAAYVAAMGVSAVVWFDGDEAGAQGAERAARLLDVAGVPWRAVRVRGHDPASALAAGAELSALVRRVDLLQAVEVNLAGRLVSGAEAAGDGEAS